MTDDELRKYVDLGEDDLLELLGAEILGTGPGFGPEDFERQIRFAGEWLQRKRHDLQGKLCGGVLETIRKREGFDALADAAIIADTLAAMLVPRQATFARSTMWRRRGLPVWRLRQAM